MSEITNIISAFSADQVVKLTGLKIRSARILGFAGIFSAPICSRGSSVAVFPHLLVQGRGCSANA